MTKNQTYLLVGGGCLLALCAVAVLLVVVLYVAPSMLNQLDPVAEVIPIEPNPRPNAEGNSMGDPSAPIHIVEYSDFQCPFCERFATDTEPLLVEYFVKTGKLYFTYRTAGNWISRNIGSGRTESQDAGLAAYCAADQGKFWEMHDSSFANNLDVEDQGAFSDKRLSAMAENIGLDMTTYQDCYDSGKYAEQVQQDLDDATAAGIIGTPFFVMTYKVNGEVKTEVIEGAQPINVFQQTIEAALLIADK